MLNGQAFDARASREPRLRWDIWGEWTLANAIAEGVGLSATLLAGILLFSQLEPALGIAGSVVLGIITGACIEGGIVGAAQWFVLREPLAALRWQQWIVATAIGAGIAWGAGMIPMSLGSLGGEDGEAASEPGPLVIYGLAALLGLVAGPILAAAQWWVLRHFVPRAAWWILAHACAWAVGMVIVFLGMSYVPESGITAGAVVIIVAFITFAGAAVGAIHGFALIWLLRERDRQRAPDVTGSLART